MTDPVFFAASRHLTAGEVATLTGAELLTPQFASKYIVALASLDSGGADALTFADGRKNASKLAGLQAAAIICSAELASLVPEGIAVLVSGRPQPDFAAIGRLMFPESVRPASITGETGVSPHAHVHPEAHLETGVIVEAGAVIGARASIGTGSIIAPNVVIGASVHIGRDCYIGSNATVIHSLIGNRVIIHGGVRIGQDGFGYVPGKGGVEKVPQIGRVIIQDDVEIGANTSVDRGALGDTVIGEGTKIDNLVQIGHNVRIGRSCIIAGQCGISGSVTLGDGVMMGGRAGLADHLTVGSGVQIAAASGVMNDIPAGARWGGTPAQPIKDAMREFAVLRAFVREKIEKKDKTNG